MIGEKSYIGPYTVIYGHGGVSIGENVLIASHCSIVASNHIFDDIHTPISNQGSRDLGITIENDVWIGTGARILDGVTIGTGAIVGAGAVVTNSIEPFTIVAGVPARPIGSRKYINAQFK